MNIYVLMCWSVHSYIKLLKEDQALRQRLGNNGRQNVQALTCKNVVLEMIEWYHQGQRKEGNRSILTKLLLLIPLSMAIPFCIISLFFYDLVVCRPDVVSFSAVDAFMFYVQPYRRQLWSRSLD